MRNRSRPDPQPRILAIDIGGSGVKMMPIDPTGDPLAERHREPTPDPSTPDRVLGLIETMIDAQEPFDLVSVGFPGVVDRGVVRTAPNLGTDPWRGFDLQATIGKLTGKPVRALNDADLQGYGVIEGQGVEIVLTLGTGLGSALYSHGRLLPNFELAGHPLRKGRTYEESVGNAELKRVGKKKWRARVGRVFETLDRVFNHDFLYVGGGNARKLEGPFADNVRLFTNVEGLTGGARVWRAGRSVSSPR